MIPIIIVIISIILDGILSNFLPFSINNLSLFTPLFTLISIFIIYPWYRKKEYTYFILSFVVGLIYDLLYTNLLFYDAVIFLIIALCTKFIYKNFELNYLNIILEVVLIVSLYEILNASIILIFNLVPITIDRLSYKISHSLILNIIYSELLLFIIIHLPKKYKKIDIN